ncbi:MAG: hypothetical protein AAB257_09130 [Nitrospinota bacterium]
MEGMTVKEVLAFAKILEENSNKFYINASMTTKLTNAKKFLGELAKEELKHRDLIANLEKKIDKHITRRSRGRAKSGAPLSFSVMHSEM